MRTPVDSERLHQLAHRLGELAPTRTTIYLTDGASAVLEGWRTSTVDADLRFEPDTDALLHELPIDFYSQALAKIERSFHQDLEDVEQMLVQGLITRPRLRELYEQIEPQLYRYPAIDPKDFRRRLEAV